jgi:hypothetical protein
LLGMSAEERVNLETVTDIDHESLHGSYRPGVEPVAFVPIIRRAEGFHWQEIANLRCSVGPTSIQSCLLQSHWGWSCFLYCYELYCGPPWRSSNLCGAWRYICV